jgi:hypothetical protein
MKRNFEDLLGLDPYIVMQTSHIAQSTVSDVINKKFEKFNPVKAKGVANTIEKDFDIDMSGWLSEYEAFQSQKVSSTPVIERAAMEAVNEKKIPAKKLIGYAAVAVTTILCGYLLYHNNPLAQIGSEQNLSNDKYKNELNKTEEANATAAVLMPPSDVNDSFPTASLPTVSMDKNVTKPAEVNKSSVKPTEANTTIKKDALPVQAKQSQITLETTKKLWFAVRYLDTNKTEIQTVEASKLEFDGARPKIFEFGHSQVKIIFGDTIIEAKQGAKIRYLFKDKKFTQISEDEANKLIGKAPSKPKDKNATN